jgi:hypothetical protein
MAAAATQHDVEAVGRGHDGAGARHRAAQRQVGPVVQRVHGVAGKAVEKTVFHHAAGAGQALFGRLEDEVHAAVESTRARQLARGAQQHGGVAVVAAAVVHAGMAAGVRRAAQLDHRQRVHVGAQAHAAPAAAAAQGAHHAGAADAFGHLQAQQAQRAGHDAGGAVFLEAELGVGMQVAPQSDQVGQQVGDGVVDAGVCGGAHPAGSFGSGRAAAGQRPASTASASSASVRKW